MPSTLRPRRRGREQPAPVDALPTLLTAVMATIAKPDAPVEEKVKMLDQAAELCAKQLLDSPHLCVREAALYLGWSPDTLKRKMAGGEVPFHRRPGMSPYFLKQELDQWLADPSTLCPATATAEENQENQDDKDKNIPFGEDDIDRFITRAKFPTR